MGDQSLVLEYQKRTTSLLNKKEGFLSLVGSRLRERRAIELIRGYVSEFKPRLDQDKIELRGFDVKQELYRLLQTVISGLALYYGVRATSTLQRLRELQQKRVISKQGADRLQGVLFTLLRLRVETHLFYGTEKEVLYHSKGITDQSTDDLCPITDEIQQKIVEAYKTLIPLHQRAERFVQGDKDAFENCSFCDTTVGTYDDQQRMNLNFDSALQSSQAMAALNPNDLFARSVLGSVQRNLGQMKLALHNAQEALTLAKGLVA